MIPSPSKTGAYFLHTQLLRLQVRSIPRAQSDGDWWAAMHERITWGQTLPLELLDAVAALNEMTPPEGGAM